MNYKSRRMLTDANGNLIPQVYDPITNNFVPLQTDTAHPVINKGMTEFATGSRVISTTATEIYAGSAPLDGRRLLIIRNEDGPAIVRIGGADVTINSGFSIAPQSAISFDLEPSNPISIYAISETDVTVSIMEAK